MYNQFGCSFFICLKYNKVHHQTNKTKKNDYESGIWFPVKKKKGLKLKNPCRIQVVKGLFVQALDSPLFRFFKYCRTEIS